MRARALTAAALAALGLASAAPAAGAAQRLDIAATVRMMPGGGTSLLQQGTFTGAPLGPGTVHVRTDVGRGRGAIVHFRMFNRRGSVEGTGNVTIKMHGSAVTYGGSARIARGTGAFSRLRSGSLRFSGHGDMSGSRFSVHLTGPVSG